MKLIAKGSSDARLIIAEKTMESLRVVSKAMEGICADPTQYLIGVQYIKMLTSLTSQKAEVEVYMPLQTDIGGATSRMWCVCSTNSMQYRKATMVYSKQLLSSCNEWVQMNKYDSGIVLPIRSLIHEYDIHMPLYLLAVLHIALPTPIQ